MKATYHLEKGHATPTDRRALVRSSSDHGIYLTVRGRFRDGEEVTRLIITTTRRDGFRTTDTLTFRNELHARAWLGLISHGNTRHDTHHDRPFTRPGD